MRKQIIYFLVAILTFAVGTIVSAIFYRTASPSVSISRRESVIEQRTELVTKIEKLSTSCGCHQGSDAVEQAKNEASSRAPISGGVINGKAVSLPQPAYPAIGKAAHASGTVVVQVVIDERGCVVSARAVSGHPLLQQAAIEAAHRACFTPTLLSGQPVKVTGVITYNFVAE